MIDVFLLFLLNCEDASSHENQAKAHFFGDPGIPRCPSLPPFGLWLEVARLFRARIKGLISGGYIYDCTHSTQVIQEVEVVNPRDLGEQTQGSNQLRHGLESLTASGKGHCC